MAWNFSSQDSSSVRGPHEVLRIFVADHFADLVDCQSGTLKEQVKACLFDLHSALSEEEFQEGRIVEGRLQGPPSSPHTGSGTGKASSDAVS